MNTKKKSAKPAAKTTAPAKRTVSTTRAQTPIWADLEARWKKIVAMEPTTHLSAR